MDWNEDASESDNSNIGEILEEIEQFIDYHIDDVVNIESEDEEHNEDEVSLSNAVDYDIGLPLEHSYLGSMSQVDGRKIYPPGSKFRLSLIFMDEIILIPGQEIPFTFRQPDSVQFFRRIINSSEQTFGMGYNSNYGTTAEIRSYCLEQNEIIIKAEGRQRFKVLQKRREFYEVYDALVEILPEFDMKDYFHPLHTTENRNFLKFKYSLTALPRFIYKIFDDYLLMEKLRAILDNIIEPQLKNKDFKYPTEPNAFSYFVLSTIPFSDRIKANLLKLNCTTHRLRAEYGLLSLNFTVRCVHCNTKFCDKEDFLVMSKRGTGGTFVNPSGLVYELFTFSKASNIVSVSELNHEYSWFPNYGWIIIRCLRCMLHVGWRFKTNNEELRPRSFWALTKMSIRITFASVERDSFVYELVDDDSKSLTESSQNP